MENYHTASLKLQLGQSHLAQDYAVKLDYCIEAILGPRELRQLEGLGMRNFPVPAANATNH